MEYYTTIRNDKVNIHINQKRYLQYIKGEQLYSKLDPELWLI